MGLKADDLRMMPITFGFAAKHLLREQCLTPERDEPFGVEIFWVHSPEPHWGKSNSKRKGFKGRGENGID